MEQAFPDMKGLNMLNNNKEMAYQTVFHSHVHLIPRYSQEDDFSITFANNGDAYSQEDMASIAQKIKEQVK